MRKLLLATLLVASLSPLGSAKASHCVVLPPDLPDPRCDWLHTHEELDPALVCPAVAALAGRYGVVTIEGDGDVYVAGGLFWDCPPYEV